MTDHSGDLERVFSRRAFIPFVTCGDPDIETTERIIPEMADAGADLIEIGIPFSDPIAEGPVIQAADIRALSNGVTTDAIFDMVERIRAGGCDVPLAVMTYMNPVFVYGPDRFMERCARAGICAVIVPDVPYEEKGELLPACRAHGVRLISMIAPTSEERISMIASEAEGFLYVVSSMGVTGVRQRFSNNLRDMVASVKAVSDVYSPVSGTVKAVNEDLLDTPEAINADPYGAWLVEVEDITDQEELLDAAAYEAHCAQED